MCGLASIVIYLEVIAKQDFDRIMGFIHVRYSPYSTVSSGVFQEPWHMSRESASTIYAPKGVTEAFLASIESV